MYFEKMVVEAAIPKGSFIGASAKPLSQNQTSSPLDSGGEESGFALSVVSTGEDEEIGFALSAVSTGEETEFLTFKESSPKLNTGSSSAGLGWGVSLTGEKEEGSPLSALVGMEVGCVGEISQHVLDLAPSQDMDFINQEEASYCTPLSSYPPLP